MTEKLLKLKNGTCRTYSCNTVVVGTGAAGYNAALRLCDYGQKDVLIVTEGVNMGTSRNTGSDKQTYYKLNLCGDYADSPKAMASDLFAGKGVDGDVAYAEAALSVTSFLHLVELGVPFPVNRYGEYIGYKTDHDPRARATSVGPLTSKLMTEHLEAAAKRAGIDVLDRMQVVSVIKHDGAAVGLLCLSLDGAADEESRFCLIRAKNVVYATGGPAGIYADTVYPVGHAGASGVAFEAGVIGKNLTEWQFGLASVAPRWNVSGTYMQVLPRFVSVDADGIEREFLSEYFDSIGTCLSMIFKKGYEWPFDTRKVMSGSSIIDLLVYRETVLLGRRVYLDFRNNPAMLESLPFDTLSDEAHAYLENAGACFGNPLERLLHMNAPAYDLYLSKGVDLKTEMLEIALCAQHNNGGLDVDLWWQTSLPHFFAVGEVAGSHGVYRPGGSALNAGQVGSTRAAQYIANRETGEPIDEALFAASAWDALDYHRTFAAKLLSSNGETAIKLLEKAQKLMTEAGGAIRSPKKMESALAELRALFASLDTAASVSSPEQLRVAYRLRDALISQITYLTAMLDYAAVGGHSRGSALYSEPEGNCPRGLDDTFRFSLDDGGLDSSVQNVSFDGASASAFWRAVRPLPEGGGFFENVWREYRENKNIY